MTDYFTYHKQKIDNIINKINNEADELKIKELNVKLELHNSLLSEYENLKKLEVANPLVTSTLDELKIEKKKPIISRRCGTSLKEIDEIFSSSKHVIENQKSNCKFSSEFLEREKPIKRAMVCVEHLLQNFKSDMRDHHYFLACITGAGMGKTCFGKVFPQLLISSQLDCSEELKEAIKSFSSIHIDYNGGGDALLDEELDESNELSLCKRLFSNGVLNLPYSRSGLNKLYEGEKELLNLKDTLNYIASKNRESNKQLAFIFIHIDEFQMANKIAVENGKYSFIKSMLESLGHYRCNPRGTSNSVLDNIFIVPFLSGTSIEGLDNLILSKFQYQYINLHPLSIDSCMKIITKKSINPPLLQGNKISILDSQSFKIFVQDLGVIPRHLEKLIAEISRNKDWVKSDIDVKSFISVVGNNLINQIQTYNGLDKEILKQLLYYSLCNVDVTWETRVGNRSIKDLSYYGHLFLQESENPGTFKLHMPTIDIYKISYFLDFSEFKRITRFPLIDTFGGHTFEEITATILKIKIDLFANFKNSSSLTDLFNIPSFINSNNNIVKFKKVELFREETKWINGMGNTLFINNQPIKSTSFSAPSHSKDINQTDCNVISLLANGCSSFDIRICFELEEQIKTNQKQFVMVVINTKFSTCDKYLLSTDLKNMIETSDSLKMKYQDSFIIPVLVSNFSISKQMLKDYNDSIIVYHKDNISSFFGSILHRVSFFVDDKKDFCDGADAMENLEIK